MVYFIEFLDLCKGEVENFTEICHRDITKLYLEVLKRRKIWTLNRRNHYSCFKLFWTVI